MHACCRCSCPGIIWMASTPLIESITVDPTVAFRLANLFWTVTELVGTAFFAVDMALKWVRTEGPAAMVEVGMPRSSSQGKRCFRGFVPSSNLVCCCCWPAAAQVLCGLQVDARQPGFSH